MAESYAQLFSTYTDEQLLALASQRDTLVGAGRVALDEEMKKRGYDPDEAGPLRIGNFARLLSTYTDELLLLLASQRDAVHEAGKADLDGEMNRRGFSPDVLRDSMIGTTTSGNNLQFKVDMISRFFLRAPNWKIFLLLFLLYFAGALGFTGSSEPVHQLSHKNIGNPIFVSMILMTMSMLCFLCWQWSLGSFLSRVTNPVLRLKPAFFHFAMAYPAVYFVFFFATFLNLDPSLMVLVIPFHLFAMYCLFYGIYFVSKSLVLAETSKPVSFYDYAGPFFLLWFFPFGIWIIQPRINRLYESRMNQFAKLSGSTVAL